MIPGLESREFYMLIWICMLTIIGSVVNYFYHKYQQNMPIKMQSVVIKASFGLFAGVLLTASLNGGESIGHWQVVIPALTTGVAAEKFITPYIMYAMGR